MVEETIDLEAADRHEYIVKASFDPSLNGKYTSFKLQGAKAGRDPSTTWNDQETN